MNKSKEDYELIYKDNTYSFFRVYTHRGILEIGSPAWCLKTKSNWDKYQEKYPEQWVVIDNRYIKNIITPNNSYLGNKYININKTWVRFGLSFIRNSNGTVSWIAHNDNDDICKLDNYTFYGVLFTTLNLSNSQNKSYYQSFIGCEYISDGILKVNTNDAWVRLNFKEPNNSNDVNYVSLSKTYSYPIVVVRLKENGLPCVQINTTDKDMLGLSNIDINGRFGKLIASYVKNPVNIAYIGLKIRLGLINIDDALIHKDFILKVDRFLVFHWNSSYYIVIDSNIDKTYNLPTMDKNGNLRWDDTSGNIPSFYLINKLSFISDDFNRSDYHLEIVKELKALVDIKPDEKKVSGFWDFLKGR